MKTSRHTSILCLAIFNVTLTSLSVHINSRYPIGIFYGQVEESARIDTQQAQKSKKQQEAAAKDSKKHN